MSSQLHPMTLLGATLASNALPSAMVAAAGLFGLLGAVAAGPSLVRLAARRSVAQPLSQEPLAEAEVIATVIAHPEWFCVVSPLEPAWFCEPAHEAVWAELCEQLGAQAVRDEINSRGLAEVAALPGVAVLAEISAAGREDTSSLQADLAGALDGSSLAVLEVPGAVAESPEELRRAAESVAAAADDRIRLGGAGAVVASKGDLPLERSYSAPSRRRVMSSSLALGVVCALVPYFAAAAWPDQPVPWALSVGALWVLAATSAVVGLVDLDTFYLDTPTFVLGAVVSWVLAGAAAISGGDWSRLVVGAVLVVGIGVFLEVANRVYRASRGIDGMGFGDTIIIVATSGVPAAISGSAQLGFHALIAGMLASIVAYLVSMRRAGADSQTPFAFGPYLAVGWPIAWAAHLLVSTLVGG